MPFMSVSVCVRNYLHKIGKLEEKREYANNNEYSKKRIMYPRHVEGRYLVPF